MRSTVRMTIFSHFPSSIMIHSILFLLLLVCCHQTYAFLAASPTNHALPIAPFSSSLLLAGFGRNEAVDSKLPKLKAKSQWDRYTSLKNSMRVRVGVRVKDSGGWFEVGRVKSENDQFTEVAVARQRALIAEHAKRLYLGQIPANAVLDWGYIPFTEDDQDGEWTIVEKVIGDEAQSGIEKKIGFEGIADKATGFYCYYHEGRVVDREDGGKGKRAPVLNNVVNIRGNKNLADG